MAVNRHRINRVNDIELNLKISVLRVLLLRAKTVVN